MGMPFNKYNVLVELAKEADSHIQNHFKRFLNRFSLIGLIIFDPKYQSDFNDCINDNFDLFAKSTGENFLLFGLTKYDIDFEEDIFQPSEFLTSKDSEETFLLCKSLNINYSSLPVLLIAKKLTSKKYLVFKTDSKKILSQLQEIREFCKYSNRDEPERYKSLIHNDDFINNLNKCAGYEIKISKESLSTKLSNFLTVDILKKQQLKENYGGYKFNNPLNNPLIDKFLQSKSNRSSQIDENYPKFQILSNELSLFDYIERLSKGKNEDILIKPDNNINEKVDNFDQESLKNIEKEDKDLFLATSLALIYRQNLGNINTNTYDLELEKESLIILNTFDFLKRIYIRILNLFNSNLDYSPLITSVSKIFEIEINLSLVQWVRIDLGIEMPAYFNKYKNDPRDYSIKPQLPQLRNAIGINFNSHLHNTYKPPEIGKTYYVFVYLKDVFNKYPEQITNFDSFLNLWNEFRILRNNSIHGVNATAESFNRIHHLHTSLINDNYYHDIILLKNSLKNQFH